MAKKTGVIFIENYIAGGGDKVARSLIEHLPFSRLTVLVNRGNDTRILFAGSLPKHVKVERYGLLTVAELSSWAGAVSNFFLRSIARGLSFLLRYPLVLISIPYFCFLLKRIGADVFIANNGGYPGGFFCRSATIASSLIRDNHVFHIVHGFAEPARGLTRPFEYCIDWLVDHRSCILTVSGACADRLTSVRNIRQQIGIIKNGIADTPPSSPKESDIFHILNVGYFDRNKNQSLLIQALAELYHRGECFIELHFVGEDVGDGCMEHCRALATNLGVAEQVRFFGFVESVEAIFSNTDVFVLCSHSEGMPMSILEAMRAAKPVIATNVGGVGEQVVDGITGFLVPIDDVAALVDKLILLKQNYLLRVGLGFAARARFEETFTTSTMITEYVKILELSG